MHKIHFPAGRAYDVPQTPSRMVRGHPSPRFLHLESRRLALSTYGNCDRAPARMVSRAPLWLSTGLEVQTHAPLTSSCYGMLEIVCDITRTIIMVAFFNSFRKGSVVCRGLDLDLSGKVAKKRL